MFRGLNISPHPKDRKQAIISRHLPLTKSDLQAKAIVGMAHPHDSKTTKLPISGQESLSSSDNESGVDTTTPKTNEDSTLERSFEKAFAKARQSACACVVRGLDPRRPWYKSTGMPSSCSELFWRDHPVQAKVIHACHFYTLQWLSERDTSWWTESITVTRYTPLQDGDTVDREPELVKAIGAWSADLSDRARDAFVSSSEIDTVPGSKRGLVDATSRYPTFIFGAKTDEPLAHTSDERYNNEGHASPANAHDPRSQKPDSGIPNIEIDDQSSASYASSDTYAESDLDAIDEQADRLLPSIIVSIISRVGTRSGTISATGSSFANDGNSYPPNSHGSICGRKNGQDEQNGQKRKRGRDDDSDQEESGGDGDAPPLRIPNAMPLEDRSARLACHFHILDPEKYCDGSSCGKKYKTCAVGFKDSKDLRDHLKKKHCGPKYFCSRCYKPFQDGVQKAEHERLEVRCRIANGDLEEGDILEGTKRRLMFNSMKKPRHTSHEEHWFDVWSILFPRKPFPTTPYMPHDAFDVTYGRIADEEISRAVFAQDHSHLADDPTEATRFLRRLTNRILQRLRESFDAGRLRANRAASETQGTINVDDHIEASRSVQNEGPYNGQYPTQTDSDYYVLPLDSTDASMRTVMPPHAHYSTQGWQGIGLPVSVQDTSLQQDHMGIFPNTNQNIGPGPFGGFNSQSFNDINFNFNPQTLQNGTFPNADDFAMQDTQAFSAQYLEDRREANIRRGASRSHGKK